MEGRFWHRSCSSYSRVQFVYLTRDFLQQDLHANSIYLPPPLTRAENLPPATPVHNLLPLAHPPPHSTSPTTSFPRTLVLLKSLVFVRSDRGQSSWLALEYFSGFPFGVDRLPLQHFISIRFPDSLQHQRRAMLVEYSARRLYIQFRKD